MRSTTPAFLMRRTSSRTNRGSCGRAEHWVADGNVKSREAFILSNLLLATRYPWFAWKFKVSEKGRERRKPSKAKKKYTQIKSSGSCEGSGVVADGNQARVRYLTCNGFGGMLRARGSF
jgi:hypothetical protein